MPHPQAAPVTARPAGGCRARSAFQVGLCMAMMALAGAASVKSQSATRSVWTGVYTEKQADRGKKIYVETCGVCHGELLDQGESPLAGVGFTSQWDGLTVADLALRIRTTMPPTQPGALNSRQTADAIAYMLRVHQFPAGDAELPSDEASQKQVRLEWTKPPAP